jgi:hypothetical protein
MIDRASDPVKTGLLIDIGSRLGGAGRVAVATATV